MTVLKEVRQNYGKLKLYINGEWIDSESTQIYESVNPATGGVIATFPSATDQEVNHAIESAHAAMTTWGAVPVRGKAKSLFEIGRAHV